MLGFRVYEHGEYIEYAAAVKVKDSTPQSQTICSYKVQAKDMPSKK